MSFGAPFGGKFPDMKPISSPPTMHTVNGIGFTVYGSRDYDQGTNTYVITLFFTIVFVPIFAISAYRVSTAPEGGWYFFGKVPLSNVTRGWNILVLLGILVGAGSIWWSIRANDPAVMAAAKIAEGDRLAAEGKIGSAAEKYSVVANSPASPSHIPIAVDKLCALFDAPLDNIETADLVPAFVVGVDSFKIRQRPEKLVATGLAQAKKRADTDEPTAVKLIELIAQVAPTDDKELAVFKKSLFEKIVAREPDNLDALSDLASAYEVEKNFNECEKRLMPKKAALGTREGARILGQILVNKSQLEDALALLEPYVKDRLERLRQAEGRQKNAIQQLDLRVLGELKDNKAPGFDRAKLESLKNNQKAQDEMLRVYLNERLRNDADFKRSTFALQRDSRVVPVAFDLGIVLLRRGQTLVDPDARKALMEKAEQTFVQIRGIAGDTDELRLPLGQVYYWLGKHDEGKKLFDEALKGPNIEQRTTVKVAMMLREVGAVSEARKLLEDNFEKDGAIVARDNIARLRAAILVDNEDRINWLTKVQNPDRGDKAGLCASRGDKAIAENRDADAERELREAIGHFNALPETVATLNNSALVYFSLYRISGDLKDLNQGITKLEKAVELLPRDSILVTNAADSVFANSVRAVIGDTIDWKALKINGGMELLGYCYNDVAKQEQYREKMRKSEGVAKARAYFERLTVLAPKNVHSYSVLASLLDFTQDRDAVRTLQNRIDKAGLDHADTNRRILDALQGKDDDKHIKDLQNSLQTTSKRVAAARKVGGVTLAVALGQHNRDKISLLIYGKQDAEGLVENAEEAYKAAPSRATHNLLIEALLARAHCDLVKRDPSYAAMAKDALRSLGASYLIAVAISKENGPHQEVLAHRDVKRANEILKAQCDAYPDEFNEWVWAMLGKTAPDWTAAKAKELQENEPAQTNRLLARQLSPLSAAEAYRQHWSLLMQGQGADANDVLRRLADKGVPLPK